MRERPLPETGPDVLDLVEMDHQVVRRAVAHLRERNGRLQIDAFWLLADRLVRHEVAEEMVVYPELRRLPGGEFLARALLSDQHLIEERLTDMESGIRPSDGFAQACQGLADAVERHLDDERTRVVPELRNALSLRRRKALGARYSWLRGAAPALTVGAPTTATIIGRVPALAHWIRDSAGGSAAPAPAADRAVPGLTA